MINMISTSTTLQPVAASQGPPGESGEKIDLYADLFAALFTVPEPVRWVEPLRAAQQTGSDVVKGTKGGESSGSLSNSPDLPINAETGAVAITKPASPLSVGVSLPIGLFRAEPTQRPYVPFGEPIETPQDQKPKGMVPPESPERIHRLRPDTTCEMPADGKNGGGVEMILPPAGDHIPVDILTLDGDDNPVEAGIDLLELPSSSSMPIEGPTRPSARETEGRVAIEIFSTPEPAAVTIVTPEPIRMPKEFPLPEKNEIVHDRQKIESESNTTFLETFTASVMVDNRWRDTARSSSGFRTDAAELVETISSGDREVPNVEESDQASDFSFDSSVNAEAPEFRPAPLEVHDAKLKEAIVEQVGTQLVEWVKDRMENPGKREITIRLKPEELGMVEITLVRNAEGIVDAHFATDNPQTQYLLDETLAQLRESLENSGVKVGSIETSCITTAFSDTQGGDSSSKQSTHNESPGPLRETFEDLPRNYESAIDRLVNLRA